MEEAVRKADIIVNATGTALIVGFPYDQLSNIVDIIDIGAGTLGFLKRTATLMPDANIIDGWPMAHMTIADHIEQILGRRPSYETLMKGTRRDRPAIRPTPMDRQRLITATIDAAA